jgi:hypothetical protein
VPNVVVSRSSRSPRLTPVRPLFFLPLALFCTSIVGGLTVLATQLPIEPYELRLPFLG